MPTTAKTDIRGKALDLGFKAAGFTTAELSTATRDNLAQYLAQNHHGDMGWLAEKTDRRGDPKVLWPAVKSIIVLGFNYGPPENPLALLDRPDRGNISVYARGRDYHDVVKKRLKSLARWMVETYGCSVKVFVDTAPVMEKPLGQRANLGWQGKHSNLVSRDFGSWLFLGEVYTDLELPADSRQEDLCGSCQNCLDICPTKAFPAPYKLDARRCISYLTIEHKGHIASEFRSAMGNRIYGCDDCLAVCPWNKYAQQTAEAAFLPRAELTAPKLAELARLDDAAFRKFFSGSPIKRSGRNRFVRNVLIALGNCGDPEQLPAIEGLLNDASPLVRAMAVWALARLADPGIFSQLRNKSLDKEEDPQVRTEWTAANKAVV